MTLCEACISLCKQLFDTYPYTFRDSISGIRKAKMLPLCYPADVPNPLSGSTICNLCALINRNLRRANTVLAAGEEQDIIRSLSTYRSGVQVDVKAEAHQETRRDPNALNLNRLLIDIHDNRNNDLANCVLHVWAPQGMIL